MIHWPHGSTKRRLGRGFAAALAGLVFGIGSVAAQTPLELPLAAPEAKAKPVGARQAMSTNDVQPSVAQESAAKPKGRSIVKAIAELPAPKETRKKDDDSTIHDPNVKKASCSSCGGLLHLATGYGCANGTCVPGRSNCNWDHWDSCWGRCIGGIYQCLCCPDPCYEPRWIDAANAAFFQDPVRPATMTRLRYTGARNHRFPDTAEMVWGKINQKGPANFESRLDWDEFSWYQEVASGGFSFFVEIPYRCLEPTDNPGHSGFGDMNLGTKSMLLDCELIQMAFQFRTYLPVGAFGKGLGTGHVSLEPSLLTTIKLAPVTYLQTQIAEWIPIAGTQQFAGSAFCYNFSLNHALWHHENHASLIGTIELNGIAFQSGRFTADAALTERAANNQQALSVGPGLRFSLCNKYDIGVGAGFALSDNGPEQLYRVEFRVRF